MVVEDDLGPLSRPGRFRDKESIRVYNGSFQLQQPCRNFRNKIRADENSQRAAKSKLGESKEFFFRSDRMRFEAKQR